jgi:hypothetical protein
MFTTRFSFFSCFRSCNLFFQLSNYLSLAVQGFRGRECTRNHGENTLSVGDTPKVSDYITSHLALAFVPAAVAPPYLFGRSHFFIFASKQLQERPLTISAFQLSTAKSYVKISSKPPVPQHEVALQNPLRQPQRCLRHQKAPGHHGSARRILAQ